MSESQTTTVVLADEGTRRALEAALWHHAGAEITRGDALDEDLSSVAIAVLGRESFGTYEDLVPELDRQIAALSFIRGEIDRLRGAAIGEPFLVPMSSEQLASIMQYHVVPTIEEFEDFWKQAPADRERMLASRDAGARLLAELAPAEAVA